jgi:hypothetical protein
MKNIVLLSDGTGNSAAKLFKTNVWRLFQTLDLTDETRQIAYYDDGVGTSSFKPLAIVGGAFGWGLKRNVLDLYAFLCRNYREGDRVYCFGFSRGAFTIRVLMGLVTNQGLVVADSEEDLAERAGEAFREYRSRYRSLVTSIARMTRRSRPDTERVRARIAFAGLWDTVAAYGLPVPGLTHALSYLLPLSVPDRNPCPIMDRACHALALDDERKTFHPVLWNEARLPADATHLGGETISQLWFAGAHSDVGGGYAEDALSYTSLDWIMGEAQKEGLRFDLEAWHRLKATMNVNGMLHEPRNGVGAAYRYGPRDLRMLCNDTADPRDPVVIRRPKIHQSVFRRISSSDDSYAPIVLPEQYAVVDAAGVIHAPSETAAQAKERVAEQEKLRPMIDARRFLHALSMGALILLAVLPWIKLKTVCQAWTICWPERAVAWALDTVLPDFLGRWTTAYAMHWPLFAVLLLSLWLILRRSARYKTRIKDRMRRIWTRGIGASISPQSRNDGGERSTDERLDAHPRHP